MNNRNFITVEELAKKTGYLYTSIIRWLRQGDLKTYWVNGKKAVDFDEYQDFIKTNKVKKPYKKKPKPEVKPTVSEELKAEQPVMKSQRKIVIEKLEEVLNLVVNSHILTPKQFMSITDILMQLNEGEN